MCEEWVCLLWFGRGGREEGGGFVYLQSLSRDPLCLTPALGMTNDNFLQACVTNSLLYTKTIENMGLTLTQYLTMLLSIRSFSTFTASSELKSSTSMVWYRIELFSSYFQCYTSWSVMVQLDLDSSIMISCWCLIETYSLTRPLYDIHWVTLTDLPRSLKVKSGGASHIWFLIMSNSNIWPNAGLLRDISLQNQSDLEIDLSMLLR